MATSMNPKRKEEDKRLKERDEDTFHIELRNLYEAMKKENVEWDERKKNNIIPQEHLQTILHLMRESWNTKAYKKKNPRDTSSACRKSIIRVDNFMWYDLIDDLFVSANEIELVPQFD